MFKSNLIESYFKKLFIFKVNSVIYFEQLNFITREICPERHDENRMRIKNSLKFYQRTNPDQNYIQNVTGFKIFKL